MTGANGRSNSPSWAFASWRTRCAPPSGQVTATLVRDSGRLHVIDIEPGDTTLRHFAIAIDVGTTTIAVQLIDLAVAQIVAARSDYNDQIACGLDVISRINYARTPERLEELRTRVLGTINRLIRQVANSRGVAPGKSPMRPISGNTVMTHLLLGLNPEHLRLAPYTPTRAASALPAQFGDRHRHQPAGLDPFLPLRRQLRGRRHHGGHSLHRPGHRRRKTSACSSTSAPMARSCWATTAFLMACACSAGPAFEGGGIECGHARLHRRHREGLG